MTSPAPYLPPQLGGVVQPYSMGPLVGWSPFASPAMGTCVWADDRRSIGAAPDAVHILAVASAQEFLIAGVFIAPRSEQRDPRREITFMRPKGLLEKVAEMSAGGHHGGVGATTPEGRKLQRGVSEDVRTAVQAPGFEARSLAEMLAEDDE